MSEEYISRSKYRAIKLALAKMSGEQIQAAMSDPGFVEAIAAAAQTGDVEAVRAVLRAKFDELDGSVQGLVAAAIAEIDALPRVRGGVSAGSADPGGPER
jgi:hypothetical protein